MASKVCIGDYLCVELGNAMLVVEVIARNNNKSLKAWTLRWQNHGR
jgi:hydrogenase maturation factor